MAVPLDQPLTVVVFDERSDHLTGLIERLEVVQVEALLLERSDSPLHSVVALGLADERGTRADAEPWELAGELVRRVLWAPVVTEPESQGDLGGVARKCSRTPCRTNWGPVAEGRASQPGIHLAGGRPEYARGNLGPGGRSELLERYNVSVNHS